MSELDTGAAPAAAESAPAPATPTPVTVVEAPAKSMSDTMAEVYEKFNPPRDEQQRFAAKAKPEGEQEHAVEAQASPDIESTEQAPSEEKSEPAAPAIVHPNSLPADLREKWGTVPPEIAKWIGERETESHKRISELGQVAKTAEPIAKFMQPLRELAGRAGISPEQAQQNLLNWSYALDQNPAEALQGLARQYGVTLSQPAGDQTQSSTEVNPEIAALRHTVSQLQRQIAETSNRVQTREQRETETQHQSIGKLVDDFSKDEKRASHWADLEPEILAQIHAIRATEHGLTEDKILERAYDRALKLNEGVQAKIKANEKAEADKKAKAEAAKKATDAKKAASVNVKSGQGASPRANGSWQDTMREVGGRLMGS